MRKKIFAFLLSLIILSSLGTQSAFSQENKYGIHILEPSDLEKASELVNSNGGNWGYVTIVIRDDDLNYDKWQGFMDKCREIHLIPLVRIATHLEGSNWIKPSLDDAAKWANFLGNLNWPVKDQYVIIFNEPNHTKEWGGELNPKEYTKILKEFSSKFTSRRDSPEGTVQSSKFMILNAGFDLAAPNSKTTMEAGKFIQEMNWEVPGIFDLLDGWVSHSYPNQGYLGKPWETGKTSVKGYEWELKFLKNQLNVKKNLPVFITETGWPANDTKIKNQKSKIKFYDRNTVANYLKSTFENIWLKDIRIKAITPFVLNYPESLFSDFSWLDKDGNPYPQFETIKSLGKVSWLPEQETGYLVKSVSLPPFMLTDTLYKGKIILENTRQSIWGEREPFISKSETGVEIEVSNLILPDEILVKPNEFYSFNFELKTSSKSGDFVFKWKSSPEYSLKVISSSLLIKLPFNLWQIILSKISSFF